MARPYWLDRIGWIVWIVSAGSSGSYRLDRIGLIISAGSSGSYRMDRIGWIVSVSVLGSLGEIGFSVLAGLLLAG